MKRDEPFKNFGKPDDIAAIFIVAVEITKTISIRTTNQRREKLFETLADYFFVSALIGILVKILLITFNFIN
jgi:hypothetical protein